MYIRYKIEIQLKNVKTKRIKMIFFDNICVRTNCDRKPSQVPVHDS